MTPEQAAQYNHELMLDGDVMSPGEMERYALRFADMPPDKYYLALYNAQLQKRKAAAEAAEKELLASIEADKEKAGSSGEQQGGGKGKGRGKGKGKK